MISVLLARWLVSSLPSFPTRWAPGLLPLRVPGHMYHHMSSERMEDDGGMERVEDSLLSESQLFGNKMLTFHPISLITVAMAAECW